MSSAHLRAASAVDVRQGHVRRHGRAISTDTKVKTGDHSNRIDAVEKDQLGCNTFRSTQPASVTHIEPLRLLHRGRAMQLAAFTRQTTPGRIWVGGKHPRKPQETVSHSVPHQPALPVRLVDPLKTRSHPPRRVTARCTSTGALCSLEDQRSAAEVERDVVGVVVR